MNTHSKSKPARNVGINTKAQKEAIISSRSKLTFIAAALASFSAPSMAQLVVNNTVMHVLDPIYVNTGTTVGTAGYALNVTNGGSFIADQGVGLTTGGNTANAIAVSGTGSSALVYGSSTLTTTGNTSHGVYVQNNGQATLDNATISTSGTSSVGMNAVTGGNLTLSNSTINTSGNGSQGVVAINAGIVTITDSTIATTGAYQGNGAHGLQVANGTTGSISGSVISTQGNSSIGLFVETTNSANTSFTVTDTKIDTYGSSSGLVASELNGIGSSTVTLNGHNIITTHGGGAGISARGPGGKIIINAGTEVSTLGTGSAGIQVASGGNVNMTGTIVTTALGSSYGIHSSGAGSSVTSSESSFVTSGASAHGIYAVTGGEVVLNGNNNTVVTSGTGSYGLSVTGADSKLTTNGLVRVTTSGDKGIGVYATTFGTVNLGDGSVIKASANGSDTNAYGLYANGSNGASTIMASNLTVETGSQAGHGIYAANAGGIININGQNNKVTTTGNGATGVLASRTDSKVTVTGKIAVTTTGEKSNGVTATNDGGVGTAEVDLGTGSVVNTTNVNSKGLVSNHLGASLKATDVSVNTAGTDSYGAYILDQATMNLTGGQIVTSGSNAHGVNANDAGTIVTLNNTSIATTGAGAHAIMSNTGAETTITQLNNVLSSTQGATLYSEGGFIEANIDGSLIQNNGMLIDAKVDANSGLFSRIDLNAKNLSMSGDIQAESSSMANLSLRNATWNGKATNATDFKLDNSSVWNMSASSDVANLEHAGQINFVAPTGNNFNTLTVRNHYSGNDGTIALHTKLGSDDSSSDQLIVGGDTSGSSKLHITNAGGLGALTVADGIQVVNVAGASNGSFGLANRVTTGLYEYDLFQNGVGANAADGNWYLCSLAVVPTEPTVYLRNLSAASNMFMHTLHDRLGEPQFTDTYKVGDRNPSSVWVRVVGSRTESKGGNGQVDLDTDTGLVHFGGDIARFTNDNNDRWNIGLMGAYGHSKIDASANQMPTTASGISRNATGKIDGYSVGGYATWYGNKDKPTGAYVDGWAQYGWYDNKVQGNTQSEESYNSSGWTASVEAGYAFIAQDKNDRQLMIEPQIQVAYNSYKADDYTDHNGTRISNSDADGVITRVGARVYSRSKLGDNGLQPFVEANWWYSDAKNTLAFNGETMSDGTPNSRYELKAGLQGEVAKNWLMWGHVGGQWGEKSYSRYEGMVGIKRMF